MRNKVLYLAFSLITLLIALQACQTEDQITYARYYVNGKGLYEKYCQNCHAADGSGLKSLFPPLTDSLYLKHNRARLACIIKYGQNQKIKINGKLYEGNMPANTPLSGIEITQILVYIGNSFGNKLGNFELETVNGELKKCK
jgi:mono/diheme cytochrome c family protein